MQHLKDFLGDKLTKQILEDEIGFKLKNGVYELNNSPKDKVYDVALDIFKIHYYFNAFLAISETLGDEALNDFFSNDIDLQCTNNEEIINKMKERKRMKTESEGRDRMPPDNNHKHAKTSEPVDKNLNVRNNFSSSPTTVTFGQYNSKIKNDTLRTYHGDSIKRQNSSTDTNKNKPLNSPKLTEQTDPLLAKDKEKDSGIITDRANLYQNKEMKINTNQNNEIAVKKNNAPQKPCGKYCGFFNDSDRIICAFCMRII